MDFYGKIFGGANIFPYLCPIKFTKKKYFMKLSKFVEIVAVLFKREFDPTETMQWLTANQRMFWSWGVSKTINVQNKGLLLRVNGHHHNGYVLITLDWSDTYEVHLIKTNGTITSSDANVYCDELQHFINVKIEYISQYTN